MEMYNKGSGKYDIRTLYVSWYRTIIISVHHRGSDVISRIATPHAACRPAACPFGNKSSGKVNPFSKPSWLLNDDDLRRALRLR